MSINIFKINFNLPFVNRLLLPSKYPTKFATVNMFFVDSPSVFQFFCIYFHFTEFWNSSGVYLIGEDKFQGGNILNKHGGIWCKQNCCDCFPDLSFDFKDEYAHGLDLLLKEKHFRIWVCIWLLLFWKKTLIMKNFFNK